MAEALTEVCRLVAEDDGIMLIVITANGSVFSIDSVFSVDDESGDIGDLAGVHDAFRNPGAPAVLVALNGDATGPGLELALAADLRICVPTAQFGFPGLTRGFFPQNGGTQLLPRLVGPAWAKDMLLTGRLVDAKEALAIGLVNRVVDQPGQLDAMVTELTAQITAGSPIGARYAKEAVSKGLDLTLDQGLGLEADLNVILQSTSDRAEGLKSFLEKQEPNFTGS